jgi:hypothetical protein
VFSDSGPPGGSLFAAVVRPWPYSALATTQNPGLPPLPPALCIGALQKIPAFTGASWYDAHGY